MRVYDLMPFVPINLDIEIQHSQIWSSNRIASLNTSSPSRCSLACLSRKKSEFSSLLSQKAINANPIKFAFDYISDGNIHMQMKIHAKIAR